MFHPPHSYLQLPDPTSISSSQAANLQHATQKVNRFAKRDPALYPLSIIVAGGLCAAGYFLYVLSLLSSHLSSLLPSNATFRYSHIRCWRTFPSLSLGADSQYDQDNPGRDPYQVDG
jgi:hypothetical protein